MEKTRFVAAALALLVLAGVFAAFPSANTVTADATAKNVLEGKTYTRSGTMTDASNKDTGGLLTNGAYRGDGTNGWNGGSAVSGVSVEYTSSSFAPSKTAVFDFALGASYNLERIVIKSARTFLLDNSVNRFARFQSIQVSEDGSSFSDAVFTSEYVEIPGAPEALNFDKTASGPQYHDLTATLNGVFGVKYLRITLDTDFPADMPKPVRHTKLNKPLTSGYILQLDEIEAYGTDSGGGQSPPASSDAHFNPEEVLAGMTTKQKVGQLFIIRPEALDKNKTDWTSEKDGEMTKYPVGGICLYSKNIVNPAQLKGLINGFQAAASRVSGVPMFITIDEEGGRIVRLANNPAFGLTAPPTMLSIGDTGNTQNAYDECARIGGYLTAYGINTDFAPVADVWSNPKNTVIGDRSFGKTPQRVADMVDAAIRGFRSQRVISSIKHFPGHGDTGGDTHEGYVELDKSWSTLKTCEIIPFQRAIETGADMIMVAHIAVPEITGTAPSSLSKPMITGKLRGELGYNGVVVTDGMEMGAITDNYGAGPAAVAAIQAGCDIVLGTDELPTAWNAVMAAVNNNEITEARLNESVLRILKLKAKYRNATITWKNEDGTVLETDENVPCGAMPEYDGATPVKEATEQYTYTFSGWTPAVVPAAGDAIYTAMFSKTPNKYTVSFRSEDNGIIAHNDGNEVRVGSYSIVLPAGTALEQLPVPLANNGFVFEGWYDGETLFNTESVIGGNLTLTARFVKTPEILSYSCADKGLFTKVTLTVSAASADFAVKLYCFRQLYCGITDVNVEQAAAVPAGDGRYEVSFDVETSQTKSVDVFLTDGIIDFSDEDWGIVAVKTGITLH